VDDFGLRRGQQVIASDQRPSEGAQLGASLTEVPLPRTFGRLGRRELGAQVVAGLAAVAAANEAESLISGRDQRTHLASN